MKKFGGCGNKGGPGWEVGDRIRIQSMRLEPGTTVALRDNSAIGEITLKAIPNGPATGL
jgi:hypothetical protein